MHLLLLSLETPQQIFILPWQSNLSEILFSFLFIRHSSLIQYLNIYLAVYWIVVTHNSESKEVCLINI